MGPGRSSVFVSGFALCGVAWWYFLTADDATAWAAQHVLLYKLLWNVTVLVLALATLPLVQGVLILFDPEPRFWDVLCGRNRWRAFEYVVTASILYSVALEGRSDAKALVGSKGFLLAVWLAEAILHRHQDLGLPAVILLFTSTYFRLTKTAGLALTDGIRHLGIQLLETLEEVRYMPAVPAWIISVVLAIVLVDYAFKVLVETTRPARHQFTMAALQPLWMWIPVTLTHLLAWYVWQPTTLTSIFICYQQLVLFGQIRTLVPTVIFAAVEIVQLFSGQWTLYWRQYELNRYPCMVWREPGAAVRTPLHADPNSPFVTLPRQDLQIGHIVVLHPGEVAPGTTWLLGRYVNGELLRPADAACDAQVLISTVAVDGETAGKQRTCAAADPAIDPVVRKSLGLDGRKSDDHLSRHLHIVRQGASIAQSATMPVWGRIVAFNAQTELPRPPTLLQRHLMHVGRWAVVLLILATIGSAMLASNYVPLSTRLIIEMFLANNVLLPMTMATMIGLLLARLQVKSVAHPSTAAFATKSSLISFAESRGRAGDRLGHAVPALTAVHLTDKTGTLTQNVMVLATTLDLRTSPPSAIAASDTSTRNVELVRAHVAITSNTPQASNMEPEEAAYTKSLGVTLERQDVDPDGSGWVTMHYRWAGEAHSVRRLHLGFSRTHTCMTALMAIPGTDTYQVIMQGSPEGASGASGLRCTTSVPMPTLAEAEAAGRAALGDKYPEGAQRNWVYSLSTTTLTHAQLLGGSMNSLVATLQQAQSARDPADRAAAIAARDEWLTTVPFAPLRYMVLLDLWRDGVRGAPAALAKAGMTIWMVTGDSKTNATSIAHAVGMHSRMVAVNAGMRGDRPAHAVVDEDVGELVAELLSSEHEPRTLLLGPLQQRLLVRFGDICDPHTRDLVAGVLAAVDEHGSPLVHVVCYASETDLKGDLVRFVRKVLRVATIFSGDGKNDIRALEAADVGLALPSGATQDVVKHDAEVAAAAAMCVPSNFWIAHTGGHLLEDSRDMWVRVVRTVALLIMKQALTAGVNMAAATWTRFLDVYDPHDPVLYQTFNLLAFGIVLLAGLGGQVPSHHDLRKGWASRLQIWMWIIWFIVCYTLGWILFAVSGAACSALGIRELEMMCAGALALGLGCMSCTVVLLWREKALIPTQL